MCGRYAFSKTDIPDLLKRFDLIDATPSLKPNDNISPSSQVPAILNSSPRNLSLARWGFVPSWSEKRPVSKGFINARAETITEKSVFKQAFRFRRCLIVADAFYEWTKADGKKRRYRLSLKSGDIFAFAGIWETWKKRGEEIISCAIITTEPNDLIRKVHNRMPVILPVKKEKAWLGDLSLREAAAMLLPYDAGLMTMEEMPLRRNRFPQEELRLFGLWENRTLLE